MKNYMIFGVLCWLLACVQSTEVPMPHLPPRLVVNSLFAADSSWDVYVSKSGSLFDTTGRLIRDAELTLWSEGELLDHLAYKGNGRYRAHIRPEAGRGYELRVFHPSLGEVVAHDTVPKPVMPEKGEIWPLAAANSKCPLDYTTRVCFTIDDPAGESNYYEPLLYRLSSNSDTSDSHLVLSARRFACTLDPRIVSEGDEPFFPETLFFSDHLFDGQKVKLVLHEYGGGFDGSVIAGNMSNKILFLRTTSRNYYLYRKARERHLASQPLNPTGNDHPGFEFYTTPFEMYSNVRGGLGIFAAFSVDSLRLVYQP